jgi:hypothetical protein
MKYLKTYLFAIAVTALAVVSCDKTKVPEYQAAPAISSEQVFFPASVGDKIKMADGETSFIIPVQRGTANLEAIEVEISASGEGVDYFIIPGTVSFDAGEATAELEIEVIDVDELGKNNFYELTLSIADASLTTPYARSSITITAGIELPWIKFDTGIYYSFWREAELERTMEYQQVAPNLRYCRIQNFWDDETDLMDIFWYWNTDTDYCFVLPTVLEPYDGENNCVMSDMASFYTKYKGWDSDPEVGPIGSDTWFAWAGPWMVKQADIPYYDGNGTFHLADWFYIASAADGVPTGRGWSFGGGEGDYFKGNSFGDYTLSISYDGMFVNPEGQAVPVMSFASTKASAKYYSDVKFMITDQETDPAETLAAIVAGESNGILSVKIGENMSTSLQLELEPGLYRLVAVPFVEGDKNDKGESTEYKTLFAQTIDFYFPGMNVAPKEVEAVLATYDMVEVFGEEECTKNGYTTYNSFAYIITGKDIKSALTYVNKSSVIGTWTGDLEDLVSTYGSAMAEDKIATLNEKGYYAGGYINRDADTEYTFLVLLTNVYGSSKLLSATYKTTAIPYSGDLVVGDYVMLDAEEYESIFTLSPAAEENKFFVTDLGAADGSSWHAVYDPEAHTLTLDGTLKGYEKYGNLFGTGVFYWDDAGSMYYATCVFASAESEGNDPLVFSVDPDTKQINKINQTLDIQIYKTEDDSYLGSYAVVTAGTAVALYDPNEAPAKRMVMRKHDSKQFTVKEEVQVNAALNFDYKPVFATSATSTRVFGKRTKEIKEFDGNNVTL